MAKSKSASAAADHKHEDLIKEIAALKKEVADLKKALAETSKGGSDSRVDKIWEALNAFPKFHRFLK